MWFLVVASILHGQMMIIEPSQGACKMDITLALANPDLRDPQCVHYDSPPGRSLLRPRAALMAH